MEAWDLDGLRALAEQADAVAAGFDLGCLSPQDSASVIELTTRIERRVNGIRLQAASVVHPGLWKGTGYRSEADWFARQTGKPLGEAIGDVTASKALAELPRVADAVHAGTLSPAEARAITGAAAVAPQAQDDLLRAAGRGMASLQDACRRARASADPDPEATRKRVDDARTATRHDESDGSAVLTLRGTPDRIGRMWTHAEHHAKAQFEAARREGRREPWTAYVFDAVEAQLCADQAGTTIPTGADAKVIFGIDWDAYRRGQAAPGERCEQIGVGPVPVSVVQEAVDGGAFIAAVVKDGTDIRLATHLGRKAKALQRTALQWRSPTCVTEGCQRTARLEIDHDIDWSLLEETSIDLLELRCHEHHDLKTRLGWTTAPRVGAEDPEQRSLLPPRPGDPKPAARRGKATPEQRTEARAAAQAARRSLEAERARRDRERDRERRRAEPA